MEDYKSMSDTAGVVDALARMLCGDTARELQKDPIESRRFRGAGKELQKVSADFLFTFRDMQPKRAFTFDPMDDDRIYTNHTEGLVRPPDETIGQQAEAVILDGEVLKWAGFRKASRLPRGLCTLTKCRSLYEIHFRELTAEGCVSYSKSMVGVSMSGRPVQVLVAGGNYVGTKDIELLVSVASVLEDAGRVDTVVAEFSDGVSLLMPVSVDDYLDLFRLRDAPLSPSGRRRALLHWVARHKRRKAGGSSPVGAHLRGIEEFCTDGLTVRLTPNPRSGAAYRGAQ